MGVAEQVMVGSGSVGSSKACFCLGWVPFTAIADEVLHHYHSRSTTTPSSTSSSTASICSLLLMLLLGWWRLGQAQWLKGLQLVLLLLEELGLPSVLFHLRLVGVDGKDWSIARSRS